MIAVYMSHEDDNQDGISDCLKVYSDDYSIPLFGDYRGVELCRINYIPSREESVLYAESIANRVIDGEVAAGAVYDELRGLHFIAPYAFEKINEGGDDDD